MRCEVGVRINHVIKSDSHSYLGIFGYGRLPTYFLTPFIKNIEERDVQNTSCTTTMIETDILQKLPVKYHSLVAPTLNITGP